MLGADAGHDVGIHGLNSAVNDDHNFDDKSFRDRVRKVVADRDSRSFGMPEEGR